MQEGGIEPDIAVPQLSDATIRDRPARLREADLRRHLVNEIKAVDDKLIEADDKPDPRFTVTAEGLKKAGVTDYQLDYAAKLVTRLGASAPVLSASAG